MWKTYKVTKIVEKLNFGGTGVSTKQNIVYKGFAENFLWYFMSLLRAPIFESS